MSDPANPQPPASAVPAPVPGAASVVADIYFLMRNHDDDKAVERLNAHVAAASRAAVEQETAWLKKLCNAEGEAKERANNLIAQLQADRDKLAGELEASQGALASIKSLVSASDDFDADEVISLCEKQVGRFSQSKEWAMQAAFKELEADLARVREELGGKQGIYDNLQKVAKRVHAELTAERAAHKLTKAELAQSEEIVKRMAMAIKAACIGQTNPPTATAVLFSEQNAHLHEMENHELRKQLDQARAESERLNQDVERVRKLASEDSIAEQRKRVAAEATATRHAELAKELFEALQASRRFLPSHGTWAEDNLANIDAALAHYQRTATTAGEKEELAKDIPLYGADGDAPLAPREPKP